MERSDRSVIGVDWGPTVLHDHTIEVRFLGGPKEQPYGERSVSETVGTRFGWALRSKGVVKRWVCIGWGSLLWNPGCLPVRGPWNVDGPRLPIEFARISDDGRLTLVVWPQVHLVSTYWAELEVDSLRGAQEALAFREGCPLEHIGVWTPADSCARVQPAVLGGIDRWARRHAFAGVVWTDLPSRFQERTGRTWSPEAALGYLRSIPCEEVRRRCEEYIRRAPPQTRTRTRSLLELEWGWVPQDLPDGSPRSKK